MILHSQSKPSNGWTNSLQVGLKPANLSFKPDGLLVGLFTVERLSPESSVGTPQGRQTRESPSPRFEGRGFRPRFPLLILHPALLFDEIGDDWDIEVLTLIGQVGPVERDEPQKQGDATRKDAGDHDHHPQHNVDGQCLHGMVLLEGALLHVLHQEDDDRDDRDRIR